MQVLLRKLTQRAYAGRSPVRWLRARRMRAFLACVRPPRGARIVYLGGTPHMWRLFEHDFDVTLVNLPGTVAPGDRGTIRTVEADACDLAGVFADGAFDVAFSNSTIEHVGDEARQAMFAREARRIARAFWVQTPSDRFPIEAHTGVIYYWRRSEQSRRRMMARWKRDLPEWASVIESTRVLSRARVQELFPASRIWSERVLGFEKSYAAYSASESGADVR